MSLPPVPLRMKEKIISGKFIDLATLLPKAMLLGSTEPESLFQLTTSNDPAIHPKSTKQKYNHFISLWMEAWNVYLPILINHSPAWALQLMAHQRIITSASAQYSLAV